MFYGGNGKPSRYEVGTLDVRGLGIWNRQLFVTSSFAAEPNKGSTPWGGLVRLGMPWTTLRSADPQSALVQGFNGRRNYWTWAFEGQQALWMLEDLSQYTPASAAQQAAEEALLAGYYANDSPRRINYRSNMKSALVGWTLRSGNGGWVEEDAASKTYIDDATYSLVGRYEPRTAPVTGAVRDQWILYTAGRSTVYRVEPRSNLVRRIAYAAPGQLFR